MVNGKQLLLYSNGGKLSLVAWRTPQGVYWVSNTLTDDISNRQMVAIAASLTQGGVAVVHVSARYPLAPMGTAANRSR